MRLDRFSRTTPSTLAGHLGWPSRAFVVSHHRAAANRAHAGRTSHAETTEVRHQGLAILTLVLVLLATAGPAAAQGKPIRIGEINSYSGLATVYTFPYKEGLLMAAKEINDAGGVLGRPIEFVFRDDKLKPDEAVKAARELVGQEKVDFLAGCISSGVGLAISAYAKEAKTLYFATHCQTSRLTWDDGHKYVAHTTNNVNQYMRALAEEGGHAAMTRSGRTSRPTTSTATTCGRSSSPTSSSSSPTCRSMQENWPKLGETDHSSYVTALLQSERRGVHQRGVGRAGDRLRQAGAALRPLRQGQVRQRLGGQSRRAGPARQGGAHRRPHPGLRLVRRRDAEAPSQARRVGQEVRGADARRTRRSARRGATPAPTSSRRPSSGRRARRPTRSSPRWAKATRWSSRGAR